jgi:Domain of unknown function (DUF4383)
LVVTGCGDFGAETDTALLGVAFNPLHNLVHLLIGQAGLAMWRRLDTVRTYGWLLAGYGLVFSFGLFAAGNPDSNFLRLNAVDNMLRLVSALAGAPIAAHHRSDRATEPRSRDE